LYAGVVKNKLDRNGNVVTTNWIWLTSLECESDRDLVHCGKFIKTLAA